MGLWYATARTPYVLVPMVNMFGSNDDLSGGAGVYTFKSYDRYFGYVVVNAVWHKVNLVNNSTVYW